MAGRLNPFLFVFADGEFEVPFSNIDNVVSRLSVECLWNVEIKSQDKVKFL